MNIIRLIGHSRDLENECKIDDTALYQRMLARWGDEYPLWMQFAFSRIEEYNLVGTRQSNNLELTLYSEAFEMGYQMGLDRGIEYQKGKEDNGLD